MSVKEGINMLSKLNKAKPYMFLSVLQSDRKIYFGDANTLKITQTHSFRYCDQEQYIIETQYMLKKSS